MITILSGVQTYVQSVDRLFFQSALESDENEIQLKLFLIQRLKRSYSWNGIEQSVVLLLGLGCGDGEKEMRLIQTTESSRVALTGVLRSSNHCIYLVRVIIIAQVLVAWASVNTLCRVLLFTSIWILLPTIKL